VLVPTRGEELGAGTAVVAQRAEQRGGDGAGADGLHDAVATTRRRTSWWANAAWTVVIMAVVLSRQRAAYRSGSGLVRRLSRTSVRRRIGHGRGHRRSRPRVAVADRQQPRFLPSPFRSAWVGHTQSSGAFTGI
jgi:hypothetical protein